MDLLYLKYRTTMELSVAEKYFRENVPFSSMKNGIKVNDYKTIKKDGYGNRVLVHPDDCINLEKSKSTTTKMHTGVLERARKMFERDLELIAQIEYCVRNIPANRTKAEVKLGLDYFSHFKSLIKYALSFQDVLTLYTLKRYPEIICFFDDQPLWELFYKLCIVLSCGYEISLYVSVDMAAVCSLIVNNLLAAGLPADIISFYIIEKQSFKTIDNGVVFTISDSCDLDSAVDSVLKALDPFNFTARLKQIFVQESISASFIEKLKYRAARSDKIAYNDVKKTETNRSMIKNLNSVFNFISAHNISFINFFSKDYSDGKFFGSFVLMDTCLNDNLWENVVDEFYSVPVVGLQTYRTTKEVTSLINNFSPFYLSLWCDKSSISDELSLAVDVNCIWINSYEKFSVENGWTLGLKVKTYRGGVIDLQRALFNSTLKFSPISNPNAPQSEYYKMQAEKAYALYKKWKDLKFDARVSVLIRIIDILKSLHGKEDMEKSYLATIAYGEIVEKLSGYVQFIINSYNRSLNTVNFIDANNTCLETSQPVGVIFIDCETGVIEDPIYAFIATAIFGNSVIAVVDHPIAKDICKIMADQGFPLISFGKDLNGFGKIDRVNGFWYVKSNFENSSFTEMPLNRFEIGMQVSDFNCFIKCKDLLEARFTQKKIIWKTHGETFAT